MHHVWLQIGQYLVRVRAQVMTRDDSTGGWVPLGGGGLSNVSVCKRIQDKNEYLIHGKRISDQSVVLSCLIKRDFEYNKVMPTFHHWKTGEKKFGLTFQTAADARAFDKGVCLAIEDLLDDIPELSPLHKYVPDLGDDDVFMALDLPVERDSLSSGSGSGTGSHHQYPPPAHLHRMYFTSKSSGGGGMKDGMGSSCGAAYSKEVHSMSSKDKYSDRDLISCDKDFREDEPYSSYVQFASRDRPHEYSYPVVQPSAPKKHSPSEHSSGSLGTVTSQPKKPIQLDPLSLQPPPLLPTKSSGSTKKKRTCGKKRRCRDCHEVYSEDSNPKGSCSFGPDPVRDGIELMTCMGCARGMLYHCLSGAEGESPPHPCALRHHRCTRRWLALGLLSLILPCLCLYIPFEGCHRAATSCAVCGARHHPS
ncbi:Sprouty-related, EVH1 domain-containing protein 2 [Orchesella cincta]|uniref:Sprouty-related, EVH1 domain-containing protein 2 n=1 Tax=Orchesella cincta TaxID=48709 RepID=A0A1D2NGH9_ORCCI|nr:Sprouty-related, EVH1 domain-containing protein 2 [Orchesella cincta]